MPRAEDIPDERRGPSERMYAGPGRQNDNARRLAELLRLRDFPLPCTHEDTRDLWCSPKIKDRDRAREVCESCPMQSSCPWSGKVMRPSVGVRHDS